jgi:hypothetical protein
MIRPYAEHIDRTDVVARALSCLGLGDYDLGANNCEHFAHWCVTGVRRSEQVTRAGTGTALVGTSILGAKVGLGFVSASGSVANLSGAGIMSGLKATGALVGLTSAAGIVLLAAPPAVASTCLVSYALRDSPTDTPAERHARAVGRAGAVAGTAIGVGGGLWAVSALGVPGLSAAGISSGLAAIGSLVSGGMAAGLVCTTVLPIVLTLVLGYICYASSRPAPPAYSPA